MRINNYILTAIFLLLGISLSFAQKDSIKQVKYTPDFKFNDGIFLSFSQVKENNAINKSKIETAEDLNSIDFFKNVLSNETIILFDNSDKVVAFTKTDGGGFYSFDNLPFGGYSLYAEAYSLSTEDVAISLNEGNYILNDIELTESCDNTVGFPEYAYTELLIGDVYPNPVTNNFKIDIESDNNSTVELYIYSITGQKVIERKFSVTSGTNTLFVNTSNLTKGSYLLSVFSKDRKLNAFRKFIK